jgi:hypothetical protein
MWLSLTIDLAKANDKPMPVNGENTHIDMVEFNDLINGLRGKSVSGKHYFGLGDNAGDPLTIDGLGAGRSHLWSTDVAGGDVVKRRRSSVATEFVMLDDRGAGVVEVPGDASTAPVAPAGKGRFRFLAGVPQFSYSTGPWTSLADGSGTVTSVGATNASVSVGGTPTIAPTLSVNLAHAFAWTESHTWTTTKTLTVGANTLVSGDKLQAAHLSIASMDTGDLFQASSGTAVSRLPAAATGNVLLAGGASTVSAWGKVGLTTHVSGTLPATNGGTGKASYAVGDILCADSTTTLTPINCSVAVGKLFASNGAGIFPTWTDTPWVTTMGIGSSTAVLLQSPSDGILQLKPNHASAPVVTTLRGAGAAGADVAGAALRLSGGVGWGAGASGDVEIWGHVAGASGSTPGTPGMVWEFLAPTGSDGGLSASLLPNADNVCTIGSAAKRLMSLYTASAYSTTFGNDDDLDTYLNCSVANTLRFYAGGTAAVDITSGGITVTGLASSRWVGTQLVDARNVAMAIDNDHSVAGGPGAQQVSGMLRFRGYDTANATMDFAIQCVPTTAAGFLQVFKSAGGAAYGSAIASFSDVGSLNLLLDCSIGSNFSSSSTDPALYASGTDRRVRILGNRAAGSTTEDVRIASQATRTNGNLVLFGNASTDVARVGWDGVIAGAGFDAISAAALPVGANAATGVAIGKSAGTVGFYGSTGAAKGTVTGAKGSNAALGSLLTLLASLGLLTDSSSA